MTPAHAAGTSYTEVMKALRLFCALAVLFPAPALAETSLLAGQQSNPMLGETLDGAVGDTVQPAFRFVEGVSDGVYDFMRQHVIGAFLPERLNQDLKAAPKQDSAPLFNKNLHDREARFIDRARAAYPVINDDAASAGEIQLDAWRAWAAHEQVSVAVDSLRDTLMQRYQLNIFGQHTGEYAQDTRHWDPGFLTMAGIVGGSFLYLNGLHATAHMGNLKLGIDISSGLKLQRVLQNDGAASHLAGLELGYKNSPVSVATEWGVNQGRFHNDTVGLNYKLRY
jgi:hypothetical protein